MSETIADGISSALFALGMVAAGAAVLLLFVAPGRGYVALGDTATDADSGRGADNDGDPAGGDVGTSGQRVSGSPMVSSRQDR